MKKKTEERPLSEPKERFLHALHKGIYATAGLKASLEIDTRKFYTVSGNLERYEYIKSLGYATWALTAKGKAYVTTYLEPALVLPFEDSKVQDFLTLFPEPYQGILRLTLSCCVAKRTKLFEAFGAGFPATLLIGEAGIGKSPIGDTLSWLQGKNPSDVKIDARLLTKGEFGGRLERDPKHKGKWRLALSYWQKQDWAQIEEFDKIINKDVTGIIKTVCHAEKVFIREGKPYPNLTVPFLTMNARGKQGQVALDKVITEAGIPFVKRNNILFCNAYKGYLGDPAKFFRETLTESPKKKVPVLTLNVPIIKTELSTSEFDLLIKLIKRGMLPDVETSHCDKRGVGIEVLAYHALTGNKDITSATYQIVKDRLWCLESLGLVRNGWRDWYNREWLEYEAVANPEKAEAIREAIKRQEKLKQSIPIIDIPGEKHKEAVSLVERHEEMLDKFREMMDYLKFPWTKIKETGLPEYILKELCSRYKAKYKGLRRRIEANYEVLRKARTEDNVRIGTNKALEFWRKEVKDINIAFNNNIQTLINRRKQGLSDAERKKDVVREMEGLISDLWKADLWATTNSVFVRDAIRKLREKSEKLRSHLKTVLRNKKDYSLARLQGELRDARFKSHEWFEEFEEDSKDLATEMVVGTTKVMYDGVIAVKDFLKGKGKSKGKKKPPKRPEQEPEDWENSDDYKKGRPFD